MGLPLKVACSEVAVAFGDAAATYLSAGFSTEVGAVSGVFLGASVAARVVRLVVLLFAAATPHLLKALRRCLIDGGGGRLSWARRSGFSPQRLWRPPSRRRCGVEIGAAALLASFLAASAASRWQVCAARCRSCRVGWRWGDFRMRRRLREG
jgi:hypothetical protein